MAVGRVAGGQGARGRVAGAPGTTGGQAGGRDEGSPVPPGRNEVLVVGRVSKDATTRELPSGDVLVAFVVVVDRPRGRRASAGGGRAQTHDSLDCTAWTASTRKRVLSLRPGDVVEVTGAVRRRFWGAGTARASRYEIEVTAVRRLHRPAAHGA